jgi:hypothetical protein
MNRVLPFAFILLLPSFVSAGDVELHGWGGKVLPFAGRTFFYDPGQINVGVPGVQVTRRNGFTVDADGGLAVGGALVWNFSPHAGLELRVDTADVDARTVGARYRVTANLPPPFPPTLERDVDLGLGVVDLERIHPVSLNVRWRTSGPTRFLFSIGGSYLPRLHLEAQQPVGLGLPGFDGTPPSPAVANVILAAEAQPTLDGGEGRFGINTGAGLEFRLGRHASLLVEGHYFYFQTQTLQWAPSSSDTPLPPLENAVVTAIERALPPAKVNPEFFQATAGLSITF